MNQQINRAEQLWHNWETKHKQLRELPGLGDEAALAIKRQQYDFLRQGLYRLSAHPRENEALHLHAIRSVTDKLQKQLYPHPVARLLHRLKIVLYDRPVHLKQFNRRRDENLEALKSQLKASGYASFNGRLENYLDYECGQVGIPMTSQLGRDSSLDVKLNFERDRLGSYHFSAYEATLLKAGEANRSFTFSAASQLTVNEAVNLLEGRAVRKSLVMADGNREQKWLRLDFAAGKAQWQEFHTGYGYDLKSELQQLAGVPGITKEKVMQSLEAGNEVTFKARERVYYLYADPAGKTLAVLDKDHKQLPMDKLLKEIKPPREAALRIMKNPQQTQEQSLGLG